jgi:hypothetical protein
MPLEYYELTKVIIPDSDGVRLCTAALITCGLCAKMISSSGGPGSGSVCIECADLVISGQARGAVVWEENGK